MILFIPARLGQNAESLDMTGFVTYKWRYFWGELTGSFKGILTVIRAFILGNQ